MPEKASSQSYIVFDLAGCPYAIPSQLVQHIEMVENITPVPNAPPFVEGVAYSRGQVIPAINLRLRFGFERQAPDIKSRLIVVQSGPRRVGLIVDSAREFRTIAAETLQAAPESMNGFSGNYLQAVALLDKRVIFLIDIDKIINLPGAPPDPHRVAESVPR